MSVVDINSSISPVREWINCIHTGDTRSLLRSMPGGLVDLSFWSPPYYVGKKYEEHLSFEGWKELIKEVICEHARVMRSGGFMVINMSDILCFSDPDMPRYMANNIRNKKVPITRKDVLEAKLENPSANRYELAKILGCSEQTIQRRLEHNNVRGGKQVPATKVLLTSGMLQQWSESVGLYLYDRRIWRKDPCWANSRWHSNSYRAVDEFEYIFMFWKPGIIDIDRSRLTNDEWAKWGSRGIWDIKSIQRNGRHESEFPEMLAERVIRLLSDPGDVVIDPFVGSGTTTAVAHRLGRRYIGIDRLSEYTSLATERTNEASTY